MAESDWLFKNAIFILAFGIAMICSMKNDPPKNKNRILLFLPLSCIIILLGGGLTFLNMFGWETNYKEYEYEIKQYDLATLEYYKNTKIEGLFIIGIGSVESKVDDSYICYTKDNNEYSIKYFKVDSYKIRLDDMTTPKAVTVYNHMVKKSKFNFLKDSTREELNRNVLIVPSNSIKVKYNAM